MMKKLAVLFFIIIFVVLVFVSKNIIYKAPKPEVNSIELDNNLGGPGEPTVHPLSIQALKKTEFPGSELVIEQTLTPGSNYARHIASYKSEGLKQYGLLTIPNSPPPEGGYPVIIFNHGYIPPAQYKTTERYIAYTDAFSRNGYVLFKPDYRGHGNSQGIASGGYGTNDYTIDVLNALSSVKKLPEVNPEKVGMWGHSMGGHITLESMVVSKDIKVGVIWAGVVGSYEDMLTIWRSTRSPRPTSFPTNRRSWRSQLIQQFGDPSSNPEFWNSISATSFLHEISGPLQLHHGTADSSVEFKLSELLHERMQTAQKESELFIYDGDDHNLSNNLSLALSRSVKYFDKYLK